MTLRPTVSPPSLHSPITDQDHTIGPADAPVSILEYGDYECPHCGRAEGVVVELLATFGGKIRYAFRPFPLVKVHKNARLAAEAAEAAGAQGKFQELHHALFAHQDALQPEHLVEYARQAGLDIARFRDDVNTHRFARRIQESMADALRSGVTGTPAFFINSRRHMGYERDSLASAIEEALKNPKTDSAIRS